MLRTHMTKMVAVAGSIALSFALVACGGSSPEQTKSAPETTSEQTTETVAEPTATTTETAPAQTTEAAPAQTTEAAPAQTTTEAVPAQTTSLDSYIGDSEAANIALTDAGIDMASALGLSVELDLDDMTPHYDVDFKAGGLEYDYEIDATTGAIMKSYSEVDD